MSHKYVYEFSEGDGSMRNLLGGKGANLAEMTGLGMPVPEGFCITTEACTRYYADGEQIGDDIREQIVEYIGKLEEISGKKFGDPDNPLLVSVRSGSRASLLSLPPDICRFPAASLSSTLDRRGSRHPLRAGTNSRWP